MKKKIFISSLLGVLAALCLTFAFTGTGRSVDAAAAVTNKDIVMEEGAAIRTLDPMGIRFTAKIKKSVRNNSPQGFGMYVCPADLLGGDGMFPADKNKLAEMVMEEGATPTQDRFIKKVSIPTNNIIEGDGNYDTFKVALVNIRNQNIDREFAAMAYVVDAGGNEIFSDTAVTRCISDVAKEALADPDNGIEQGSEAEKYLKDIKADSNDVVMRDGTGLAIDKDTNQGDDGKFCYKAELTGTPEVPGNTVCTFRLRREFRGSPIAIVSLYAKASAEGMTICGKNIPTADFEEITFERYVVQNDRFTVQIIGNGTVYIDRIRVFAMKSLGLDEISLGATEAGFQEGLKAARLNVLPNGNVEYNSLDCGLKSDGGTSLDKFGFRIGKPVPEDEYLVFRFKYNADMEDPDKTEDEKYFHAGTGNEGLWFSGIGDKNHYFAIFGDDLKDYTIYNDGAGRGPCYGSYHRKDGLTTKPDTWYYAVATDPGDPELVRHYYRYCHIEISGMYSVPGKLKGMLFKRGDRPGQFIVPSEEGSPDNGVTDLGLNCIIQSADNGIVATLTEKGGVKEYSNGGSAWGPSAVKFELPEGSDYTQKYIVLKFKYDKDNGWDDDEGLWCAFNYGETTPNDPWLQVFDDAGYDYTRYDPNNGNAIGTYHRGTYSTKPDTWYYMLNRAGAPVTFTVGTAAPQKYTFGGLYAITGAVKDTKFVKGNYPFRFPYESKALVVNEQFTLDMPFVSYNAGGLTYTSSNPQVATAEDGVITAHAPGECDITVALNTNPVKKATLRVKVTAAAQSGILGGFEVREFPLDAVELRDGGHEGANLDHSVYPAAVMYKAGPDSADGNVRFTTGGTVSTDEYLVIKFRYMTAMEKEGGTKYFLGNSYANEGLWIRGYDYGGSGCFSGHETNYFSIFDENFYDYTLYQHGNNDDSYEGTKTTIPYGSFHGRKGLTTKPDTWYYAVAPVKGDYQTIGSYNVNLYIEVGGIYAVKENVRDILFVPQHYPMFITLPYDEKVVGAGEEAYIADDIVGASVKSITKNNLSYTSSDTQVATVDASSGKITGVTKGVCDITVTPIGGSTQDSRIVRVRVLPRFDGSQDPGITSLGLDVLSVPEGGASLTDSAGGKTYSASGKHQRDAEILVNAGNALEGAEGSEGKYLMFKFRYFDDMFFGADEGLWFLGFHAATGDKDPTYFAVFDEYCYDYTIYNANNSPFGTYRRYGFTTNPGTWYYAVTQTKGNWYSISSYYDNAHLEIGGVYAISETFKNNNFVRYNYPESFIPPEPFTSANADDIRAFDLTESEIDGTVSEARSAATLYHRAGEHNRLLYLSGDNQYNNAMVGFKPGGIVGEDEYTVIKFRYFNLDFLADTYSNEGIWISGFGGVAPTDVQEYFSIFDEDYYDYTLYKHANDDDPYEGTVTTFPYGSFHSSKGITTEPDTWYYAVAPRKGSFDYISFYNYDVNVEVEGIYAVKDNVRSRFKAQNYPAFLVLSYYETEVNAEGTVDLPVVTGCIRTEKLRYRSSNEQIATVDAGSGKITGVAKGQCDITVYLSDGSGEPKTVSVTVKDDSHITALDLNQLALEEGHPQEIELTMGDDGILTYKAPSYGWREAEIILNAGEALTDKYLVFKFRYFEDMYFERDEYSYEGLWPMGYDIKKPDADPDTSTRRYFAVFDEDYYDYSKYERVEGDTSYTGTNTERPYGTCHRADRLTTMPDTWYYAVAPIKGNWYSISSCYNGAHLEIGGVYAVSQEVKDKFVPKNYPGVIADAATEMSVLIGEARNTANALVLTMPDSNGPATAYFSDDENIAMVDAQGVVTGVKEGDCYITVRFRKESRRIKVHVLPVPELGNETVPEGITSLGTSCIGTGTHAFAVGDSGMVHYEVFDAKAVHGHDAGTVNLSANIADDAYLVIKAMYTPGMNFIDETGNEGLWILGHRSDAIYNTDKQYDYFSVIGKGENSVYTDYTIYRPDDSLPYGSHHNYLEKNITTELYTWYYFVAPQKGNYTDFGSFLVDADMIIGGVYSMPAAYYNEHIIKNLDIPALTYKLETVKAEDSERLGYPSPRERLYAKGTGEPYGLRLAAEVPDDRYIRFEIKCNDTDLNSLNFTAVRGRTYYNFGVFGTDENKTDYNMYRNGDVMQGVCGIHNTLPNTSYYLIAPVKGNFDRFELTGGDFNVTIKDIKLIDEETKNQYIAIATNNSAEAIAEPESGQPAVVFGVFANSQLPVSNPYSAGGQASGGSTTVNAEANFRAALGYFKSQNIDTLLLGGNIIYCTSYDAGQDGTDGEAYETMNGIMDEVWGGKNRLEEPGHVMYTLGKHEYYHHVDSDIVLSEWAKAGYEPCQSFEVNGYTFISVDISDNDGMIDRHTKDIVEKRLAAAQTAYSDKPIFLSIGIPPLGKAMNNTVTPTDNGWINSLLNQYPQVVMFCSGTDYSIRHPQSINQDNATVVNVGPGTYGCVPEYNPLYDPSAQNGNTCKYDNVSGEFAYKIDVIEAANHENADIMNGYNDLCTGLVVRVFASSGENEPNRIEIERVKINRDGQPGTISEAWSFTAGGSDYKKDAKTTDFATNHLPQLSNEGENSCSVAWNASGDSLVFNLKPSDTESMGDNIVDCYKVQIYKEGDANTALYTKNYVSDYWCANGYGELNGFEMFVTEENRQALKVEVTAIDAYGNVSNTLDFYIDAPAGSADNYEKTIKGDLLLDFETAGNVAKVAPVYGGEPSYSVDKKTFNNKKIIRLTVTGGEGDNYRANYYKFQNTDVDIAGKEAIEFYIYNPSDSACIFSFDGLCGHSHEELNLPAGEWTKIRVTIGTSTSLDGAEDRFGLYLPINDSHTYPRTEFYISPVYLIAEPAENCVVATEGELLLDFEEAGNVAKVAPVYGNEPSYLVDDMTFNNKKVIGLTIRGGNTDDYRGDYYKFNNVGTDVDIAGKEAIEFYIYNTSEGECIFLLSGLCGHQEEQTNLPAGVWTKIRVTIGTATSLEGDGNNFALYLPTNGDHHYPRTEFYMSPVYLIDKPAENYEVTTEGDLLFDFEATGDVAKVIPVWHETAPSVIAGKTFNGKKIIGLTVNGGSEEAGRGNYYKFENVGVDTTGKEAIEFYIYNPSDSKCLFSFDGLCGHSGEQTDLPAGVWTQIKVTIETGTSLDGENGRFGLYLLQNESQTYPKTEFYMSPVYAIAGEAGGGN